MNIDEELVRHVAYFYKYYSIIDPHGTNRVIRRSRKYYPEIRKIFKTYRLPEELAFAIPFVESAFVNKARSNKKAVGLFQFLKGTARAFHMKVSGNIDERMDYQKSASACAMYLSKNRDLFDSTVLSIGSFHHGTSRLTRVLRRLPVKDDRRDFVSIFNHRRLGKYSKEYIPKCLAAALVFRVLENMGMDEIPEIETEKQKLPRFAYVKDLEKEYPDILRLNPDLQKAKTTYLYATTRGYMLVEDLSYPMAEEPIIIAKGKDQSPEPPPAEETVPEISEKERKRLGVLNAEPDIPLPDVVPMEPPAVMTSETKKGNSDVKPEEPTSEEEISETVIETTEAPATEPAGKTMKVPRLAGEKWDESIHQRFENREIVMNQTYTGVIAEIGVIFDQNLKTGDEWPEDEVLILEVGRPPIPEDDLTSEEYTRFIQEYMSTLRQSG